MISNDGIFSCLSIRYVDTFVLNIYQQHSLKVVFSLLHVVRLYKVVFDLKEAKLNKRRELIQRQRVVMVLAFFFFLELFIFQKWGIYLFFKSRKWEKILRCDPACQLWLGLTLRFQYSLKKGQDLCHSQ